MAVLTKLGFLISFSCVPILHNSILEVGTPAFSPYLFIYLITPVSQVFIS